MLNTAVSRTDGLACAFHLTRPSGVVGRCNTCKPGQLFVDRVPQCSRCVGERNDQFGCRRVSSFLSFNSSRPLSLSPSPSLSLRFLSLSELTPPVYENDQTQLGIWFWSLATDKGAGTHPHIAAAKWFCDGFAFVMLITINIVIRYRLRCILLGL